MENKNVDQEANLPDGFLDKFKNITEQLKNTNIPGLIDLANNLEKNMEEANKKEN